MNLATQVMNLSRLVWSPQESASGSRWLPKVVLEILKDPPRKDDDDDDLYTAFQQE